MGTPPTRIAGGKAAAAGPLPWPAWVKDDGVGRFDDLVEGLPPLRGAVIVVGAALVQ